MAIDPVCGMTVDEEKAAASGWPRLERFRSLEKAQIE